MPPLSSSELEQPSSKVSSDHLDKDKEMVSETEVSLSNEVPAPEPDRTVSDFNTTNDLIMAMADTSLNDWVLKNFDEATSISKPNHVRHEAARLMTLKSYNILDSQNDEPSFDDLTKEAQKHFNCKFAVVSLVDLGRQWFKSIQGLPAKQTPRCVAFCAHVVKRDTKKHGRVMVVNDATLDPRFEDNPLVINAPHIRFYAGAVLQSPEGHNLGTFCIIDTVARPYGLSQSDMRKLELFADETVLNMILRA
jgi:hypothetical protein